MHHKMKRNLINSLGTILLSIWALLHGFNRLVSQYQVSLRSVHPSHSRYVLRHNKATQHFCCFSPANASKYSNALCNGLRTASSPFLNGKMRGDRRDAGELDSIASDRLAAGRASDTGQVVSELPGTVVIHVAGLGVGLATPFP
jgi:hypothetical protein